MRIFFVALAFLAAQPCLAQQGDTSPLPTIAVTPQDWSLTLGLAPVVSPAWLGSRDMTVSIFPDLRVNYKDVIFASVPDGLGWNAINSNGLKAGPLAKIRFGRDEESGGSPFVINGGSDALLGLGDIGAAGEVGVFVEKRFGPKGAWQVRAEVRQGFGGHESVVADASLNYRIRIGRTSLSAGPRATFASSGFNQRYFGINAEQSARSGLEEHKAKGGLLSFGVGGSLFHSLNQNSAVTVFTGLDRLGGSVTSSPLIREKGTATQFSAGVGYGWRFGF